MYKIFSLLLVLLLAVNALFVWRNWKKEVPSEGRLACSFKPRSADAGNFILPGAFVLLK